MKEKIVLVTGSTYGIGFQTALALAQMGARVLVHGRNRERGERALERIRQVSENPQCDLVIADLPLQDKVRQLAQRIQDRYHRLDVLINNAGVYMPTRKLTQDGIETTFAVNHLAPFLLTRLLLDRLKASAPSRIVMVSSTTHQSIRKVDFGNLQGEKAYDPYTAYALSKLGNILFCYALATRLKGTGVKVNALHPGAVNTKLLRAGFGNYGQSPAEGARTPVYLASSPDVEGVTGEYFVNERPVSSSPLSCDRQLQEDFWRVSEELTGAAE
jgi:NAD(P)-dependent dehydrogenase (short-subunit alcohol dehydrogenase family)